MTKLALYLTILFNYRSNPQDQVSVTGSIIINSDFLTLKPMSLHIMGMVTEMVL